MSNQNTQTAKLLSQFHCSHGISVLLVTAAADFVPLLWECQDSFNYCQLLSILG